MVEVFKTNVKQVKIARQLTASLLQHFPQHKVNFDLQDCDRILRIEGSAVSIKKILEVVTGHGYECSVLE